MFFSLGYVRFQRVSSLAPNLGVARRPTAWYSAGFLIREAAARQLQVDSREIRVGLLVPSVGSPELFLADELANGAGYATYLGQDAPLEELIENGVYSYLEQLEGARLRRLLLRLPTQLPQHGLSPAP